MGRKAGGSGVWVLIAFLAIGYWVFNETREKQQRLVRDMADAGGVEAPAAVVAIPEATLPESALAVERADRALENDDKAPRVALAPETAPVVETAPSAATSQPNAAASGDCFMSSGAFALPEGTQSVDWKVVNRSDYGVDVEVVVHRLRLDREAEVVAPGPLRKTLRPGAMTHNANSVGVGKPFPPGSDFEIVVRHSAPGVLPTISFWSDHGNSEIPGTRIGPRDFVAVGGYCAHD